MVKVANELSDGYALLKEYNLKYGFLSVASLIIKYYILNKALDHLINSNENQRNDLEVELEKARFLVQDHYDQTKRTPHPSNDLYYASPYLIDNKTYLRYDSINYCKKYYQIGEIIKDKIIELDLVNSNQVEKNKFYIYVVNKNGKIIVYNEHIPLVELINGRQYLKYKNLPITHPLLVHNYDLVVQGAGEIIFVKDSDNKISGVIFNNKSGHFRPPVSTINNVKQAIHKTLQVPEERIIGIAVKGV